MKLPAWPPWRRSAPPARADTYSPPPPHPDPVMLTACPADGCPYTGTSPGYTPGACPNCGTSLYWRLTDPDAFYAVTATRGMVIHHPDGYTDRDGGHILILEVDGPDDDGMVTFITPTGAVRLAEDWPCKTYTPAEADLEAFLLTVALDDLR